MITCPVINSIAPRGVTRSHDVLAWRTNPNLPESELRDALECVRGLVGEDFLWEPGWHPLRELWRRPDHVATCELFWLGCCLLALSPMDRTWVNRAVAKIKLPQRSRKDRTGAVFEIIALGSLRIGGHRVMPAANSQSGYDGTVVLDDDREIRISIKNFGRSDNQVEFDRQSAMTRDHLLRLAAAIRMPWLGLRIDADALPMIIDWFYLRLALPAFLTGTAPHARIADIWRVQKTWPGPSPHGLAAGFTSHSIFIAAPHAESEVHGFRRNVHRAISNIERYATDFPMGAHPVVIIKIPTSASMSECIAAARSFLERPGVRTASVFLYQSSIIGNPETRQDSLHHNMSVVSRSSEANPFALHFSLPVGLVSTNPSRSELWVGSTVENLDTMHTFYESTQYETYPADENGLGSASSWTLSPGQQHIGVLEALPGMRMVFELSHPPRSDLALFL